MKVFILGPYDKEHAKKFSKAADALSFKGQDAIDPTKLEKTFQGLQAEDYYILRRALIDISDAVLPLDDWEDSNLAADDCRYAESMGKRFLSLRIQDSERPQEIYIPLPFEEGKE